jgi:hypothetical protein
MAFNIIISEDLEYSNDVFNKAVKIKALIKVLISGHEKSKTLLEFDKSFISIDTLNKSLSNINPYGASEVSIFLEVSAFVDNEVIDFVPIGDNIPILEIADKNGFSTQTYHGDSIFPYSNLVDFEENTPIKSPVLDGAEAIKKELTGDIQLKLITKDEFERILKTDYESELPKLDIDEVTEKLDDLTAQYNKLAATIATYKKQATAYLTFEPFDEKTANFSGKYYEPLRDVSKSLSEITRNLSNNNEYYVFICVVTSCVYHIPAILIV